jgi:hypothetical protein
MKQTTTIFGLTLTILGLALVFTLNSSPSPAAAAGTYTYTFDTSLSPWVADADSCATAGLVLSTNNLCPGGPANSDSAALGVKSNSCPGSVGLWMVASFPGDASDKVDVSWNAINDNNCLGCTPMYYIGTSQPSSTSQFTSLSPTIGSSWNSYSSATTFVAGSTIYVAIGWHQTGNLGSVGAVDIDCVDISIRDH